MSDNNHKCIHDVLKELIKVGLAVSGGIIGSIIPGLGTIIGGAIGTGVGSVAGQLIIDHTIDPIQTVIDTAIGGFAPGVGTVAENFGAKILTNGIRNAIERIFGKRLGSFLTGKLLPHVISDAASGMILGDAGTVIRDGLTGKMNQLMPDLWQSTKRGALIGGAFGIHYGISNALVKGGFPSKFNTVMTFLDEHALPARKIGAMAAQPHHQ